MERKVRHRIAQNVVAYRKKKNLTQEALSYHSGVSDKHIQDIEYGEVNVTIRTLCKLCKGLKINLIDLVN